MFEGRMTASIGLLVLVVLGLVGFGTPELGAQERDLWYATMQGSKRIASSRVQVSKGPDGQLKFVSETRMRLNFFGQRQEMRYFADCSTSQELQPLSIRSAMTVMSGGSITEGTIEGNTLTLASVQNGEESTQSLPLDPALPALFDVCLGDWLGKQPPELTSRKVQMIEMHDDGTWQIATVTATRASADEHPEHWRIETDNPAETSILVVAEDGFEQERIFEAANLRVARCSKEEAADLDEIEQTGRTVLSFELDRSIPHRDRLTDLTIELRWNDIPLDQFTLEDRRQRLVEHSEEDGKFRAVVNISKPNRVESPVAFPVTEEGFQPFLAETDYVKPEDPEIQKTAQEIVQGKANALDAAQALCTWVADYVEDAMIAETLTGPQVLNCKTGKCSEHSTLFASLARAVGIPTRIVLGERMVGNIWGGHMWNEVYVGEWVPVDSTVDEVGESFALLKFIHSDTVDGTQPLRWGLVESLSIHIQDVAWDDPDLVGKYPTGLEGNVYTNDEHECRIAAPSSDWTVTDKSTPGAATIRFQIPEAEGVMIHFVAFAIPPGTPAGSFAASRIEQFRPTYDEFEITTSEAFEIQGIPGHLSLFGGRPKGSTARTCVREVVWVRKSSGFLLNLIATEADHDEYLADFEELLETFEFLTHEQ